MPAVEAYTDLVQQSGMCDVKVWGGIAGRYFPDKDAMIRWIDQPSIVPFLESLPEARRFMPEYADYKIVGALASFYIDPTITFYGERQGLIMLGVIDGLLQVLNQSGFAPRTF